MIAKLKPGFARRYGPWALVTGASEGIGRSFAEELAREGLNLILVARRLDKLNQLAEQLKVGYGVKCHVISADLSKQEQVESVLEQVAEFNIGLIVCNAGFGTAGNFLDSNLDTELDMLNVNCAALTHMTHTMGRRLLARGNGGLIMLSSILAFQGVPRSAHYAATKAYVQTLGEALQVEWSESDVDLLIVAPGPVETGFAARSNMNFGKTTTPDVVACESLAALGNKRLIHPGWLAKLMAASLATAPRRIRVRIMSQIMRQMTKHLS